MSKSCWYNQIVIVQRDCNCWRGIHTFWRAYNLVATVMRWYLSTWIFCLVISTPFNTERVVVVCVTHYSREGHAAAIYKAFFFFPNEWTFFDKLRDIDIWADNIKICKTFVECSRAFHHLRDVDRNSLVCLNSVDPGLKTRSNTYFRIATQFVAIFTIFVGETICSLHNWTFSREQKQILCLCFLCP